jgi:hypothetical protein|tara:strand:+ start:345 stop:743 length:399 start_codon:yes stop_codon:yes gene_type:complete
MWSNIVVANDTGRFTFLGLNQCAPFEGVLYDPLANASILMRTQSAKSECGIRLTYELGIQATEYDLQLKNLTIRHDALTSEYDMRIQSLERESDALATALKKKSKKHPVLWVAVGIASGMALTYGAYKVFDE